MKISINNKLINQNKKITQFILYGSLALLAFGFIWTIRNPEPSNSLIGYLILIPAYLLVQISIFLSIRWGKSPRPDEIVHQSLKGLDDKYSLYIYTTGVPHLLVGPVGLWIINPFHQRGEITYEAEKNRFKQKGGPFFIAKMFAQEGLPNIFRDNEILKKRALNYFKKELIDLQTDLEVINIFYANDITLNVKNSPLVCIKASKLKDYIRKHAKKAKTLKISVESFNELRQKLPKTG